jgi:flagellar basal-body rod protein FlgB
LSLIDTTQLALEAGMRGAWLRQTLLTNNIANANTPGYQREDVDFQATLRSALAGSGAGEAGAATGTGEATAPAAAGTAAANPEAAGGEGASGESAANEALSQLQFHPEVQPGVTGPEGNGVNMDQESAQIAENGLDYQAMTQVLGARDQILRSAMGVS